MRLKPWIHGQYAAKKATTSATGKLPTATTGSNIRSASIETIWSPATRFATMVSTTLIGLGGHGTSKVLATVLKVVKLSLNSLLGVLWATALMIVQEFAQPKVKAGP